jgi:osmotically-inducible protein OsmY
VFAVFGEVAADSLLKNQEIHVTARDTTLILSGSVADSASHERLLEIARAHLGVFALADSVRVGVVGPRAGAAPGKP